MRTNNSKWLQPVLAEVANADPATFKAICAADWQVDVVYQPSDLAYIAAKYGQDAADTLEGALSHATGVTIQPKDGVPFPAEMRGLQGATWLNRNHIEIEAADLETQPVKLAAAVLVHEFVHHNGVKTEAPAYDTATVFAQKMGEPAIAERQQSTKRQVVGRQRQSGEREDAIRSLRELVELFEGMR